jgi:glucosamine 6-phosphate synthetase-like amidotransferase/phosphosugar isomerase protein
MSGSNRLNRITGASCEQSKQIGFVHGVPYHLGYGLTHPIALEGALKLKEITYAHCEGIFSSEFMALAH